MKDTGKVFFAFGVILALLGAFLMWNGHILGEDATGIAQVLGITAIGFIASGSKSIRKNGEESVE